MLLQELLFFLAKKLEAAKMLVAEKTSDVRFIAQAIQPTVPLSNNSSIVLALATLAGLTLGAFAVFFQAVMKETEGEFKEPVS